MANQIRVHTSVEVIQDVGTEAGTLGSQTYTEVLALDKNADARSWGGNYNLSTAPADGKICFWKNAICTTAGADTLADSLWTSSSITSGVIPTTAYVVAVEYVKELGTVATVGVTLAGEVIASLTLGESIVIPWHAGEVVGSISLTTSAYSAGVNEATVNVMLAGT